MTTVPVAASCRSNTHLDGVFITKAKDAAQGAEIIIVYASHANNVPLSQLWKHNARTWDRTTRASFSDRRPDT